MRPRSEIANGLTPRRPSRRISSRPDIRMHVLPSLITALLYLAAAALSLHRTRRRIRGEPAPRKSVLMSAWGGAWALHTLILYRHTFRPDGLNLEFFNAMSLILWLVAGLLGASTLRRPLEPLAVALLPVSALAVLVAGLVPEPSTVVAVDSVGIRVHILVSLLAYSVLTFSALQALLLAIQDQHLHRHRPGGFVRTLPPLQEMEQFLFQLITAGVILLTLSLVTGFLYVEDLFAQHLVHKTVLSITAWLVFSILLWGRWRFGWRGRKAIRWTLWGFAALLLAYLGTKFVIEFLLPG